MPAALNVALVVGTLSTMVEYTDDPGAILAGLNQRLHARGTGFTTCLALRFSADRRVLTVANAGHLPPYRNGREMVVEPSLPLGLDPDAVFPVTAATLGPGDHLALMTDGVPEAMQGGELFGFAQTEAISGQNAAEIAEAARAFGQSDDITVMTLEVLPLAADTSMALEAWEPA
jgi:serine phosphatase RsbU (regulator of sigma subunit)